MALNKPSSSDSDGFLSRWSQRKQALRKGEPVPEPTAEPDTAKPTDEAFSKQKQHVAGINTGQSAPDLVVHEAQTEQAPAQPPAPTMQDVHTLTPQSDFKPFMRSDVLPEVKNAAMKQLFKDPHFNVMDMMDIYVDDYSKPDPLPPEMLRKMAVTQFLGFWKEEEEEEAAKKAAEAKAREDAQQGAPENVAQSVPENTTSELTQETQAVTAQVAAPHTAHDHSNLQLQPDDAAGHEGALRSAG